MTETQKTVWSSPPKYLVVERSAHMPTSCQYPYDYCAVVETDGRGTVSMISPRARGVRALVSVSRPYPRSGASARSSRQQALAAAHELAEELQAAADERRATEARALHRTEGA